MKVARPLQFLRPMEEHKHSSSAGDAAVPSWKCTICGFVEGADTPPRRCPECGARDTMFVPTDEPPHGIAHNPLQPHDERDQTAVFVGPGHGCLEED
jgi:rubredoxin